MIEPVVSERTVECRTEIEPLWRVLGDTPTMTRFARLGGPRTVEPIDGDSAARYRIRVRAFGQMQVWEELPFESVYLRVFRIRQRMLGGALTAAATEYSFFRNAQKGTTTVTVRFEQVPRSRLMGVFARWVGDKIADRLAAAIRTIDDAGAVGLSPPQAKPSIDDAALVRATIALSSACGDELATCLAALVVESTDEDLARIRPYALADAWKQPRRDVLSACLDAVRVGLLELRWEVLCPSCRLGVDSVSTLAAVEEHRTCPLCELSIGLDAEDAVEATFTPSTAVRRRPDAPSACVNGPAHMPHVRSQVIVPARGVGRLVVPGDAGDYRLFVRGGSFVPVTLDAAAPDELAVDDRFDQPLRVRTGGTILVRSTIDRDRHAKLEDAAPVQVAATVRDVTALPRFRRDFSKELLHVDRSLRVSRVALFFSDLTGSTQLYSTIGDAAALRLVQDHFKLVLAVVERRGGTLVKTIGDAVMAAFGDELDAVSACLDVLEAFAVFRREQPNAEAVEIKLGLYCGQSYLVTANGILDYFGQTVNIAARLQAQAGGSELVTEASLAEGARQAGRLARAVVGKPFHPSLKGVDSSIEAVRITLDGSSREAAPTA